MMFMKLTKLEISRWDLDTLLDPTFQDIEDKEKGVVAIEMEEIKNRNTLRTSTRLPKSLVETMDLEEPPAVEEISNSLNLESEITPTHRRLRNSRGGL